MMKERYEEKFQWEIGRMEYKFNVRREITTLVVEKILCSGYETKNDDRTK